MLQISKVWSIHLPIKKSLYEVYELHQACHSTESSKKKNTDTLQMNLSLLFKAQLQSNFHDYVDIIY